MKELVNFVRTIKHKIDMIINDLSYEVVFVMGNTSCDMDSTISSILLAFIKNIECKAITYTTQNEITYNNFSRVNRLFVPLINCPKGKLSWRLDIAELLNQFGLEQDDFFYYEEVFGSDGTCNFETNFLKRKISKYFYLFFYYY